MSELNIETFNDILFGAFKDQSDKEKIKLLRAEIEMVEHLFMDAVSEVLDELEANGYKSEKFQKVQNIKNNSLKLLTELARLECGECEEEC